MANINYDLQDRARIALNILFILSVTVANFLLLAAQLRRGRQLLAVQPATVLSLAAGDLLLVFFSLMVNLLELLEYTTFDCTINFLSAVYRIYLLQFAFSLDLILLALYFLITYKGHQNKRTTGNSSANSLEVGRTAGDGAPSVATREEQGSVMSRLALALACGGLPWLVAVMVVMPLTISDMGNCGPDTQPSREIAYVWVCLILPTTFALLASCGTALLLKSKHLTDDSGYTRQVNESGETFMMDDTAPGGGRGKTSSLRAVLNREDAACGTAACDELEGSGSSTSPMLYPNTSSLVAHTGTETERLQTTALLDEDRTHSQFNPSAHIQDTNCPVINFKREKSALFAVAIIHFACIIPYACYKLTFAGNPELYNQIDKLTQAVLFDMVYWLAVLRSVLAPICWIAFMRN